MDDIKSFRQWNSKTPGHPENFVTAGVSLVWLAFGSLGIAGYSCRRGLQPGSLLARGQAAFAKSLLTYMTQPHI